MLPKTKRGAVKTIEVIQEAGDLIFVPSGKLFKLLLILVLLIVFILIQQHYSEYNCCTKNSAGQGTRQMFCFAASDRQRVRAFATATVRQILGSTNILMYFIVQGCIMVSVWCLC